MGNATNENRRHYLIAAVVLAGFAVAAAAGTEARAATFVVDQKHAKADDAGPGSTDAPFKTIAKGVSGAKAGDTVLVKAGTYPELVRIAASGAPDKPITLKAAPGERVIVGGSGDRHGILWAADVGHLVIDGFVVSAGKGKGSRRGIGSADKGGHHIEIRNCVVIGSGISLNGCSDSVVRRCVQTGWSTNGVSLTGCKRCTVQECEIFDNGADGLVVTHGSDDCKVLRNYIHNHWYASHPDALQVYRGVTNFLVEGNLLFNSGQGFMMEETDGGVFRNNMLVGTHHSGILLGHQNTHNWLVEGNTIAYTSFKAVVFSGKNTRIRNNVITTGADNQLVCQAGKWPCVADHNLYWKPEGKVKHHVPEDQDKHSKFADPKFRSAPPLTKQAVYYIDQWVDKESPKKCTTGKLCIGRKGMPDHFKVGDHVEVNFDGLVRKVTEVTEDSVAFAPPLEKLHHIAWDVVANWKDKTEFVWDLRLADDSPGKGMGDKGQDVGSNIDIQAYMRGDFDGDGKRDLPELPEGVLQTIEAKPPAKGD